MKSELPIFPQFTPIKLEHKDLLREIAAQFPSYSDFNFVSMFSWNTDDNILISRLNSNIIAKFSDYNTGETVISFLGDNQIPQTIHTLLEYCKDKKIEPVLQLIGEDVINKIQPDIRNMYDIEEDRDNHDYMLSSINLSDIEKLLPKKRTKYRHFEKSYGEKIKTRVIDLDSGKTVEEIEKLLNVWKTIRVKNDEEVNREFTSIKRSLRNANDLNLQGFGTYVDEELVAFTIFEVVDNKTAMLHFGKANTAFIGASELHHNRLAQHLYNNGVGYLNNEQDMGIEGLRHSKMSYLPTHFLKKYRVKYRQLT